MTPAQEQFLLGLRSLVRGVRYVASSRELLAIVVPRTLVSLVACLLVALAVWSPCLLLRLPPMRYAVPFEAVLEPTALVVLRLAQQLVPSRAHRGSFFAALDARAPGVAAALSRKPIVRGWAATVWAIVADGAAAVAVIGLCAAVAQAWLLPLFLVAWTWCLGPLALVAGAALALAWCCAPALRVGSFALHWFTSPLAFALFVAVFFGVLRGPALATLARGAKGFVWSLALAKQLLTQLNVRLPHDGWKRWTHEQRFVLCGFGFPLFLVSRLTHPIVGLALLEALQGAAAFLLVEMRAAGAGPPDL